MNDHNPTLEREIAREAALSHIPARAVPKAVETKTFANLTDDAAGAIANLMLTMDQADKALDTIAQAAAAILEKEKHARTVVAAVRASTQK